MHTVLYVCLLRGDLPISSSGINEGSPGDIQQGGTFVLPHQMTPRVYEGHLPYSKVNPSFVDNFQYIGAFRFQIMGFQ